MSKQVSESTALQCSVLVLNKAYVPIHVISARRAIVLMYRDLAEVIHVEDGIYNNFDFETWLEFSEIMTEERSENRKDQDWVQGIGFSLLVPRVLRLFRYDRVPRPSLRFNRRNLFARDGNTCQYCNRTLPTAQLSLDHVIPRSRGGETSWSNVVCCCLNCNTTKGNKTPSEAGMKLICKPVKPFYSPLVTVRMESPKYRIWSSFIQSGKTGIVEEDHEPVH